MVLELLKWLKETSFYEKNERNYKNMNFCTKVKFTLRRKKEFMNFPSQGKNDIIDFWE